MADGSRDEILRLLSRGEGRRLVQRRHNAVISSGVGIRILRQADFLSQQVGPAVQLPVNTSHTSRSVRTSKRTDRVAQSRHPSGRVSWMGPSRHAPKNNRSLGYSRS